MDMTTSLRELGVPAGGLRAYQRHLLDTDGLVILPGLLDLPTVEKMRQRLAELHDLEGDSAGTEVNREPGADRLSNLLNKDSIFDVCFTHPTVLAAAQHILTDFKLSSVCSRDPQPATGAQALHADWTEDQPNPGDFQVCNSIWLLDDFTADNGATRFVPGSHRSGAAPEAALADPEAPHPEQQLLTGPAGTVAVFNGHLWHGGTLNATRGSRRSLMAFYTRRHNPQQVNQRALATPETLARLGNAAKFVLDI